MKVRRREALGENVVHPQAKPSHPSPLLVLCHSLLFFLLLIAPSTTSAQDAVKPVAAYQSHFTSLNDKTLYIRGGRPDGSVQQSTRQFFALDLTPLLSNSIKLSWKQLNPVGPNTDFKEQMPMAVTPDNQEVTYFGADGNMSVWSKTSNSWGNASPICPSPATVTPTMSSTRGGGQSAAMDPATGRVYIPHGANNGTQMLTYMQGACAGENMPANTTGKYSAWNEAKGALYMLATMAGATETYMWAFNPSSKVWSPIPMQGELMPLFNGSCMVSTGNKLIVFGGTSKDAGMNSDIFILDTNTNLWSKGSKPSSIRQGMACATGGDYFVVWSGNDNGYVDGKPQASTLFYNIKTNKWIDENSIPSDSGNNPGTSNDSASKSSGMSAFTIGKIIAGVVVIAVIVWFLIHRHRRRKQLVANNNRSDSQNALKLHSTAFPTDASNAPFAPKAQMDVPVAAYAAYAPRPFTSSQNLTTLDQQQYHIVAEHLPATPAIPTSATIGRSVSTYGYKAPPNQSPIPQKARPLPPVALSPRPSPPGKQLYNAPQPQDLVERQPQPQSKKSQDIAPSSPLQQSSSPLSQESVNLQQPQRQQRSNNPQYTPPPLPSQQQTSSQRSQDNFVVPQQQGLPQSPTLARSPQDLPPPPRNPQDIPPPARSPQNLPPLPRSAQDLPLPPRNPEDRGQEYDQVRGSGASANPLEQLAQVQARHEQALERIRQEHQAELERMRRVWQE
ncbi:hypothetical protein BGZ88_011003 [Linnemannia elongata]|nr:hypothetical protein BGZ88_011003 [Linnemannia elongata]